jgi:isopenicillin N synthase-like dioxygenase
LIVKEHWEALVNHFAQVTDGLGRRIDPEIFETVVALNALGMPTVMSCGGHLDDGRGLLLPWVDLQPDDPEIEALIQAEERLVEAARTAHQRVTQLRDSNSDRALLAEAQREANAIYKQLNDTKWQIRVKHSALRWRLASYLEQFYEGRLVPFDRRLIMIAGLRTRLQNQGAVDLYLTAPYDVQRQKLHEYRQEMEEFTKFLKAIYFSQQNG